jgi:hypothetical protein
MDGLTNMWDSPVLFLALSVSAEVRLASAILHIESTSRMKKGILKDSGLDVAWSGLDTVLEGLSG